MLSPITNHLERVQQWKRKPRKQSILVNKSPITLKGFNDGRRNQGNNQFSPRIIEKGGENSGIRDTDAYHILDSQSDGGCVEIASRRWIQRIPLGTLIPLTCVFWEFFLIKKKEIAHEIDI